MRGDVVALPLGDDCWGRILGIRPISYIVDWSRNMPSKADAAAMADTPIEPYRENVIQQNVKCHHERLADGACSLDDLRGLHQGETLVLVGAGPSAAGIAERLAPFRDQCKVMVCNKALQYVPDADYFYLIEALADAKWWAGLDTSNMKVISPTHVNVNVAAAFAPENHFYCWSKDARHTEAAPKELPLVCGACHVGTSALHVAHIMGFSRVLLLGFDFSAFNPVRNVEDHTIVGTFYGDGTTTTDSYIRGHGILCAIDIRGDEVMLAEHMFEHRDAMAITCDIARDAGMDVVNCAGGGMLDIDSHGELESLLGEAVPCL